MPTFDGIPDQVHQVFFALIQDSCIRQGVIYFPLFGSPQSVILENIQRKIDGTAKFIGLIFFILGTIFWKGVINFQKTLVLGTKELGVVKAEMKWIIRCGADVAEYQNEK